jgi:transposase
MLGDEKKLDTGDMLHCFTVEELIPPNHLLRRIDAVLDTSWIRDEVADCYSDRGRPSWDPEVILRMILLGYLYGLSEVRLVDEVRMHMGYRWFCRLQPSDPIPDRTTLVKLRNEKWKRDIWVKLLEKTVRQCVEVGLVSGKHVSIDGTKIKANASLGSLEPIEPPASLKEHLLKRCGWERFVPEEEDPDPPPDKDDDDPTPRGGVDFKGKSLKNDEVRSKTDPDARIYRKNDGEGAGLAYIGNICIDTKSTVTLAAEASQGRTSGEWIAGANLLDEVERVLGKMPEIVTADKGYGVKRFYAEVDKRGIMPHIPPLHCDSEQPIPRSRLLAQKLVPLDRAKKLLIMRRGVHARNRAIRARYTRGFKVSRLLRLRVERLFGEGKECHALRRARYRGQDKVDSQIKITFAVMNLKRLAAWVGRRTGKTLAQRAVFHLPFQLPSPFGRLNRLLEPFARLFGISAQPATCTLSP